MELTHHYRMSCNTILCSTMLFNIICNVVASLFARYFKALLSEMFAKICTFKNHRFSMKTLIFHKVTKTSQRKVNAKLHTRCLFHPFILLSHDCEHKHVVREFLRTILDGTCFKDTRNASHCVCYNLKEKKK